MAKQFPDQAIPETKKDLDWCKRHIEYAEYLYDNKTHRRQNITKNFKEYNGEIDAKKHQFLSKTYGKVSTTKFIDYRYSYPKINLINGEFLKRPLNSFVRTVNKDAVSKKMDAMIFQLGMMESVKEVEKLRNVVGLDVAGGAQTLDKNDPDIKAKLNPKTKNERDMQLIIDAQKKNLDIKTKLSRNFLHVELAAECFGKVEILENNTLDYRPIDPRNAIYEEIDDDMFLQRTPIIGERRTMFIHDVIRQYAHKMTKAQLEQLEEAKTNPNLFIREYSGTRNNWEIISDNIAAEVISVQWFSLRPIYYKISENKNNPDEPFKKEISPESFEKNEDKLRKQAAAGKFKLQKQWKTDIWEATKIGHDIYVDCRRKPYQQRRQDQPSDTWYDYTGLLYNTIDGKRVSIQELLSELNFLLNTIMFQINRELAKNKGKVAYYDLAALPLGKTVNDVLYNMTEDGLVLYNSHAEGNQGQRDSQSVGYKEQDLGFGNSMQQLISLKINTQDTIDRLSGINEGREGFTPASSTATSAVQNLQASRTITETMFYFMERFSENVLLRIAEGSKITWGFLENGQGDLILGSDGIDFTKLSKDFAFEDYAIHLGDGAQEVELRQKLNTWSQVAINAGELRIQDAMKADLADTIADAIHIMESGFKEVTEVNQQAQQQQSEAAGQQQQAQIQAATEDREDRQAHEVEIEMIRQSGKSQLDTQQAKNKALLQQDQAAQQQAQAAPGSPFGL